MQGRACFCFPKRKKELKYFSNFVKKTIEISENLFLLVTCRFSLNFVQQRNHYLYIVKMYLG